MRLVKLTLRNGEPIWVNPNQVISVRDLDGQSALSFAIVGESTLVEGITDHGPYCEVVKECPKAVAGLFLDPVL